MAGYTCHFLKLKKSAASWLGSSGNEIKSLNHDKKEKIKFTLLFLGISWAKPTHITTFLTLFFSHYLSKNKWVER